MKFRHPGNGHIVETTAFANTLGALVFGPWFYLVNGLFGPSLLLFGLLSLALGVPVLTAFASTLALMALGSSLGTVIQGMFVLFGSLALLFWVVFALGAHRMVCEGYRCAGWFDVKKASTRVETALSPLPEDELAAAPVRRSLRKSVA